MAEARATNPLIEQFRRGGVPRDLRLMAAQGLLPLKPEDLVEMWTDLVRDADEGVRGAAVKSLTDLPAPELLPILKSRETPPVVLSWAVANRTERELREVTLQNTSLPDETIEGLAPSLPQELAELVVINQTRLLRRTSLLEAVESNPGLNNDQRRRLRELRETFHVGQAEAPPPAAAPAAPAPPPPEPTPAPEPEGEPERPLTEAEACARYLTAEEQGQADKVNVVQKIYTMNTAEKLITALKGSREERAILIRDPNRLVSSAVLGSPRITEAEIDAISAMKNVSDDILRKIGTHREHVKRYAVVSNLVRNPRTPLGIALTLVSRLNPRDLKGVSVDRNVPEAVRKHATKFVRSTQK
jgi:hypothetical protein